MCIMLSTTVVCNVGENGCVIDGVLTCIPDPDGDCIPTPQVTNDLYNVEPE